MDKQTLVQKILFANLDVVGTEILPLIEKDFARLAAQTGLNKLKETVLVVLDENPDNKEQLNLIWGKITSDPQILASVESGLLEAVSLIDDDTVKQGVGLLVVPFMKTLTVVQDDVKPNGEQLKQIWLDFIKSPEFINFLLSNAETVIKIIIKSDSLEKIVLNIIKLFQK